MSKKRSVIQTFFPTTTYTSRNVFMKSGINNSGKKPEMVDRGTKKAPGIFKALGNLLWVTAETPTSMQIYS
ncbi:hypothetical protein ACFL2S_07025 [Thermodesulfobacteriota bacterium]